MLAAAVWREVRPREGVLTGDGLYTVRADESLKLEYVTNARTVQAGEVLARFRSPERRAEIAELELRLQILETQRQVVQLQPLVPDNELVRNYERHNADQRQLLASLANLIPDHALVVREQLRDTLDKPERINSLNTRIEDARRELQQAIAKRTLAKQHLNRVQNLSDGGAAAVIELNERTADNSVLETEVAKLTTCIANMEIEKKHLQESMPRFAACTSQQAEDIGRELSRARQQLAGANSELQVSEEHLRQDRKRADLLKQQMLQQNQFEVQQCRAKLEGIHDVLEIKAPFSGIVAYSDPAPCTALPLAPVVVLAPDQGFRFRLRLPDAEVKSLSKADSVPLGLIAPILHRRFPGRLLKWDALRYEPGYVVAELACMPPAETIHDLVSQDWVARDSKQMPNVNVRLLWSPPLYVVPLFSPAMVLMALGLFGLCLRFLAKAGPHSESPTPTARDASSVSAPEPMAATVPSDLLAPMPTTGMLLDSTNIESGALGRNLQLLGQRFREAIKRQDVDPALLQAIEWAIDRHHTRAIQHLALGLDHDPEIHTSLKCLLDRLSPEAEDHGPPDGRVSRDMLARILQIVRTVSPEILPAEQPGLSVHDRLHPEQKVVSFARPDAVGLSHIGKPRKEGASR
jgi:multidrug resistance efflux pump